MSKVIDENVVKMEFDNSAFERNVNQSMSTLDKLKSKLNFKDSKKSVNDLNQEVGKVNFNPLASGVETVKLKFSALELAAVTALKNMVDSAVNAGTRIVKALTIDPIMDGYREYELKMNSIQTMMMSSGESLETVNGYLNQLNTYADKTIYSFSDMTSNIGKFTNAGVKLQDAVKAIQGISNEAAVSGANANEASRAMYNFAQALSAGSVKLIDWKSIENANMATVEFKNELIKTGVALGTLTEQNGKYISTTKDATGHISAAFDATTGFNDALSSQWMTTDVLVETLGRYADETTEIGSKAFEAATKVKTFSQLMDTLKEAVGSGWAESFEIMVGDFEEARELMTEISNTLGDIIGSQADARNTFLTGAFGSGWKQMLREGIFDATTYRETVTQVAKDQGIAVDEIIKKTGSFEKSLKEGWLTSDILAQGLEQLTNKYSSMSDEELRATGYTKEQVEALKTLNENVKNGTVNLNEFADAMAKPSGRENLITALRNTFQSILSLIDPISQGIHDIFGDLDPGKFVDFTKGIADFTENLKLTDSEAQNLRSTVKGLASIVDFFWEILKKGLTILSPLTKLIRPVLDLFLSFTGKIGEAISAFEQGLVNSSFFQNFSENYLGIIDVAVQGAKDAYQTTKDLCTSVKEFFAQLGKGISDVFSNLVKNFGNIWKNNPITKFFEDPKFNKSAESFSKAGELISNAFRGIGKSFSEFLGNFNLVDFLTKLTEVIGTISFSKGMVSLTGFLKNLKNVGDELPKVFGSKLSEMLDQLSDSLSNFSKKTDAALKKTKATSLLIFASAILVLTAALTMLSKLNFGELATGLTGLIGTIGVALGAFKLMLESLKTINKAEIQKLNMFISAISKFGIALILFATAAQILGGLSWEGLLKGVTGVAALSATMTASAKVLASENGVILKGSAAMISFALAIKILSTSVEPLGRLDLGSLAKGVGAIGALCLEMSLTLKTIGANSAGILKGALSLEVASLAIMNLILPMQAFAKLEWSGIAKGLTTIGASLAIFSVTLHSLSEGTSLKGVAALTGASVALNLIAIPLKLFSTFDLAEICTSLAMLGGSLTIMIEAVKYLGDAGSLKGVSAMILMAAALDLLAPALMIFSGFSLGEVATSLLVLGGALAELAVALHLMEGNLAGAAALVIVAAGIDALAVALKLISTISAGGIIKSLLAMGVALAGIAVAAKAMEGANLAILKMAGTLAILSAAAVAFGVGMSFLIDGLDKLTRVLCARIKLVLETVAQCVPIIVEILSGLISGICTIIIQCIPQIGEAVYTVIHTVLQMLVKLAPEIAEGALQILDQVLQSLASHADSIANSIVSIFVSILNAVANHIGPIVQAGIKIVESIFGEIFKAIGSLDPDQLLKLVTSAGIMTAFMAAMSMLKGMIPSAMQALLEFGVFIGEFMAILTVLGAIESIPGVQWLLEKGGEVLEYCGVAIGRFVGGIVGGIAKGATSTLPSIGEDLSAFMTNMAPFFEGAKNIDMSAFDAVDRLVSSLTRLTGQNILEGLTSWFTGGTSFKKFGEDLVELGTSLGTFSGSVKGIDSQSVTNATNATQAIITLMTGLPKSGGLSGFFNGSIDFKGFADVLPTLGSGIKSFSDSVQGVKSDVIQNAVVCASAISEFINNLPDTGGIVSFIKGSKDVTVFTEALPALGTNLKSFSDSVDGIEIGDAQKAVEVAKMIAAFSENLPKHGGLDSWIHGDNTLSAFAKELESFGTSFANYAKTISSDDFDAEKVTASANAAKAISAFAENLPKNGGIQSVWNGDNSLSSFARELSAFGTYFTEYADSISGLDTDAVESSVAAAQSLSAFAKEAPSFGGLKTLWDGGIDLSEFGRQLSTFGPSLKEFSTSVSGISMEDVEAASSAAKLINEFAKESPNFGGLQSWFSGEIDLTRFGEQICAFGPSLKTFATSVSGLVPEDVQTASTAAKMITEFANEAPKFDGLAQAWNGSVNLEEFGRQISAFAPSLTAFASSASGLVPEDVEKATTAAKMISEFANEAPKFGGLAQVWDGSLNLEEFGRQISSFAPHLMTFASSTQGIAAEDIETAATSAKVISEWAKETPNFGGLSSLWNGEIDLGLFGTQIEAFGEHFATYASSLAGIDPESISKSTMVIQAVTDISNELPKIGGVVGWWEGESGLDQIGAQLERYGGHLSTYSASIADIDWSLLDSSIDCLSKFADVATLANTIETSGISNLGASMSNLGISGVDNFIKAFDPGGYARATTAGSTMIDKLIKGVESKASAFKNEVTQLVNKVTSDLANGGHNEKFKLAGTTYMQHLTQGITEAASAISDAIRTILDGTVTTINGYYATFAQAGVYLAQGLANGIRSNSYAAIAAAQSIANQCAAMIRAALKIKSPSRVTYELGAYFTEGFTNGITSKADEAVEAAASLANESVEILSAFDGSGISDAIQDSMSFEDSFTEGLQFALDNLKDFDPLEGIDTYAFDAGQSFMNQLADGMSNRSAKVQDIMDSVSLGLLSTLEESDLSNLTLQIGKFSAKDLEEINSDRTDDEPYSFGQNGRDLMDYFREALRMVLDEGTDEVSDKLNNPVISPVLDLSEVETGSSRIGSLIGQDRVISLKSRLNSISGIENSNGLNIKIDTNNVVGEIQSLKTEIKDLKSAILSSKVVLDTGALVGGIAGPIDRELGRRAMLTGRGI